MISDNCVGQKSVIQYSSRAEEDRGIRVSDPVVTRWRSLSVSLRPSTAVAGQERELTMYCNETTKTDLADLSDNIQADWLVRVITLNNTEAEFSLNTTVNPSHSQGDIWTFDRQ